MSASEADDKAKKAAKKAKLKEEAAKLGIPYEELKAQKKEKKNKRKREAEKLEKDNAEYEGGEGRNFEKKRMRTYSKDFTVEHEPEGNEAKRRRTRSMDKAEESAKIASEEKAQSPDEWRKTHSITIKNYGSNVQHPTPDPFIEFSDAPFNPTIQKTLKSAGFARPTLIQSQVSSRLHHRLSYGFLFCYDSRDMHLLIYLNFIS